jgi:hypothetical protein
METRTLAISRRALAPVNGNEPDASAFRLIKATTL